MVERCGHGGMWILMFRHELGSLFWEARDAIELMKLGTYIRIVQNFDLSWVCGLDAENWLHSAPYKISTK